MASGVYNKGLHELAEALTDLGSADLRVLLMTAAYTFTRTHNFVADVVANEISAAGYSRQALTGETVVEDDTNHRAYLDANDSTFGTLAAGQTIGGVVLFRHTGSDATAPLIAFIQLPSTPTNGSFGVSWAAPGSGGILYLASAT